MRLAVSTIPTPDPNGTLYYDPTYYANLDSEYLADDMSEFMTSRAFADEVHRELASSSTPMDIDVGSIMSRDAGQEDAPLHRHQRSRRATPEQGAAIAGSISRILSDPNHVAQYLTALTAYHTQMEIVTPPVTGRANTPLGLVSEIALRTLIGLMVGIGLAFLVDYLDPSVRTREEAERLLEMPVLGEIPKPSRVAATGCSVGEQLPEPASAMPEATVRLTARSKRLAGRCATAGGSSSPPGSLAALAAYVTTKLPWVEPRWRSSVLMQATGRLDYGNFLALEKELRPLAEQVLQLDIMRERRPEPAHRPRARGHARPHARRAGRRQRPDPHRRRRLGCHARRADQPRHRRRLHAAAQRRRTGQTARRARHPVDARPAQPGDLDLAADARSSCPPPRVLGVLVAGLVVLVMVYLDDAIRSTEPTSQRYLELPVLGSCSSIPNHGAMDPRASAARPTRTRSQESN